MVQFLCLLSLAASPPRLSAAAFRQEMWENAKERYLGVTEQLKQYGVNIELAAEDIRHGRSPVDSLFTFNCVLTSENTMRVEIETRSGGEEGAADVHFGGAFEWGKHVESISGGGSISGADNGISSAYSYNRVDGQNKLEVESNRSIWDARVSMGDPHEGPVAAGIKVGPLKVLVDPYVMAKKVIEEAPELVQNLKAGAAEASQKIGGISTRLDLTDLAFALRHSTTPPNNFARSTVSISLKSLLAATTRPAMLPIGHIAGVVVDRSKGDVILYGFPAEGTEVPTDVLVAAAHAEFVEQSDPWVSLEPDPADPAAPQTVRVGGVPDGERNSEMIRDMITSDYKMKRLVLGLTRVEGMTAMVDLLKGHAERWHNSMQRFWIVPRPLEPGDVRVGTDRGRTIYEFDTRPLVRTEPISRNDEFATGTTKPDFPEADLVASDLTDHFSAIERQHPEFGFTRIRQILELSTAFNLLRTTALPDNARGVLTQIASLPVGTVDIPAHYNPVSIDLGQVGGTTYAIVGGVLDTPLLTAPVKDSTVSKRLIEAAAGDPYSVELDNVGIRPSDPETLGGQLLGLSKIALAQNRSVDALKLARDAIRLMPLSVDAHLTMAHACHVNGRLGDMLAQAEAAIKLDPDSFDAHMLKADAMFLQGCKTQKWLDAVINGTILQECKPVEAEMDRALAINPHRGGSVWLLAALMMHLAQDDKGEIGALNNALEAEPTFYDALRQRAETYSAMKDFDHARKDAKAYLSVFPGDPEMTKLLSEPQSK